MSRIRKVQLEGRDPQANEYIKIETRKTVLVIFLVFKFVQIVVRRWRLRVLGFWRRTVDNGFVVMTCSNLPFADR